MAKSSTKSKKQARAGRKVAKQRNKRILTILIVGAIALFLLAYQFYPRAEAPQVSASRLDTNPSLGSEDALVVLTEFGDFTCSACKSWHQAGVVEQYLELYGDSLRVEWRDFPIITPDSPKAAQAGQCAHDQDLFWEYLDRVYGEPGSSYGNAGVNDLRRYATDVGLDLEEFNTCLDSNQHERTVEYDLDAARGLGLPGTPSFLVNGKPIIGANPQLVAQAIEEALAAGE